MKQVSILLPYIFAIKSSAFTVSTTREFAFRTSLYSSNDEEELLILGSGISEALQGLGSEAGYLDAARKRNEAAKAKMLEDIRLEEEAAERKRREREERGNEGNFGPGDMSAYVDFTNDGFEESGGNDETGGWEVNEQPSNEVEEEEPKLFLFGDDDAGNDSGSGLIL